MTTKKQPPPTPEGVDPEAWATFERYRREKARGKGMTSETRNLNAEKLRALTPEQQRATVNLTVERGWTGIFPERITRGEDHEARRRAGSESALERRRRVNQETLERARAAASSSTLD